MHHFVEGRADPLEVLGWLTIAKEQGFTAILQQPWTVAIDGHGKVVRITARARHYGKGLALDIEGHIECIPPVAAQKQVFVAGKTQHCTTFESVVRRCASQEDRVVGNQAAELTRHDPNHTDVVTIGFRRMRIDAKVAMRIFVECDDTGHGGLTFPCFFDAETIGEGGIFGNRKRHFPALFLWRKRLTFLYKYHRS